VVSPDDRHIVARNMYRKEINILRKTLHQVGFIYKVRCQFRNNKIIYVMLWTMYEDGLM